MQIVYKGYQWSSLLSVLIISWIANSKIYSKSSKILNTSSLPKEAWTNSADPDQTASEEAPCIILPSILWIPALITNILVENRKKNVFETFDNLQ